MKNDSRVYRLSKGFINPGHDKRARYGENAIANYPKGILFRAYWENDVSNVRSIVALMPDGKTVHVSYSLYDTFMRNSVNSEPANAIECLFYGDIPMHCADDVLQYLFKARIITSQNILFCCARLNEQWASEQ